MPGHTRKQRCTYNGFDNIFSTSLNDFNISIFVCVIAWFVNYYGHVITPHNEYEGLVLRHKLYDLPFIFKGLTDKDVTDLLPSVYAQPEIVYVYPR